MSPFVDTTNVKDSLKQCPQCNEIKPKKEFRIHTEKGVEDTLMKKCKKCEYINSKKSKDAVSDEEFLASVKYRQLMESAKQRNIDWKITPADIVKLHIRQNGQCAYTGHKYHVKPIKNEGKVDKFSASVDRIVNTIGYIPSNIAIVTADINRKKNNDSIDEINALKSLPKSVRENIERLSGLINADRNPNWDSIPVSGVKSPNRRKQVSAKTTTGEKFVVDTSKFIK